IERELHQPIPLNQNNINTFLQKEKRWIGSISQIDVTNEKGQIEFSTHQINGKTINYANYDFFKNTQNKNTDQLIVTKLIKNPNGHGWVHLFVRPYHHADGSFAGIITAILPAHYFNHLIEGVNIGTKGVALIQDLDMRIVARNPILETPNGQVGFVGAPPQL